MADSKESLRKFLQDIAKQKNYKLAKIDITLISSRGGADYTKELYIATISESLKPDINVFAKVSNIKEELRVMNPVAGVYNIEGFFYGEMAVNFKRVYNRHNVPSEDRMAIPKHYGHVITPEIEMLVLENLEAKGFQNYDRLKPFSWEYAATAVAELAKFHAIAAALRDESAVEFEKTIQRLKANATNQQSFTQAIIKGSEHLSQEYKSRLRQYCTEERIVEMLSELMKEQRMLVFGDFRPSNLMHRRRNGKLEIITLDYQTLRMGSPVVDLIYFIFSGSDEEFRRLHYQNLLDHYFTTLTVSLKQLNIYVEKVYPREVFEKDLVEFRPLGLFTALALLPLFLQSPEEAADVENMDSLVVEPNQLALDRINGIVRDFVKWGVLK